MSEEEMRSEPRPTVRIVASMSRLRDPRSQTICLTNLSANGAMGEADDVPPIGEPVNIRFGGGITAIAVVVWRVENRFGLRFDRALDVGALGV